MLGLILASQKAAEAFGDRGGSIINISSVVGVAPIANGSVYSATKAAVDAVTKSLAQELGPRKIRVNSLSPGAIETPALENAGLTAEQIEQAAAAWVSQTSVGRRGKPEEIAAAVVFLASDESSYITGIDLAVDGGMAQV